MIRLVLSTRRATIAARAPGFGRWLAVWLLCAGMPAALGHTRLLESVPAEGEVLAAGATSVTLYYSDPIHPRFSDFAWHFLGDAAAAGVAPENRLARAAVTVDAARRSVAVSLPEAAAPGWYALDWEVLADDGHRIVGTLRLQISR